MTCSSAPGIQTWEPRAATCKPRVAEAKRANLTITSLDWPLILIFIRSLSLSPPSSLLLPLLSPHISPSPYSPLSLFLFFLLPLLPSSISLSLSPPAPLLSPITSLSSLSLYLHLHAYSVPGELEKGLLTSLSQRYHWYNHCPSLLGPSQAAGSGAPAPSEAGGIFAAAGMTDAQVPRAQHPKMHFTAVPLRPGACANPTLTELTFEWKETENKSIKYTVNCREISAKERNKAENAQCRKEAVLSRAERRLPKKGDIWVQTWRKWGSVLCDIWGRPFLVEETAITRHRGESVGNMFEDHQDACVALWNEQGGYIGNKGQIQWGLQDLWLLPSLCEMGVCRVLSKGVSSSLVCVNRITLPTELRVAWMGSRDENRDTS